MAVPVPALNPHAQNGLASPAAWDQVVAPARPFLTRVTQRLAEQVNDFEPEIAEYARYALDNQGKQLRPALVALSGEAVGTVNDNLVNIAIIIEMIHLATLVHDDIMDEATVRRSRPTLAARWGNQISVLLGDCLFAHALNLAARFATADVSLAVSGATGIVCTGEILQSHRRRRWSLSRAEYFRVLEMKTAELFALACELGAKLAGGTPQQQAALRRHGLALGTAYQIYDDCLDLFGTEINAGKSLGTDLATGKVTLPVLVVLERSSEADRRELIDRLDHWEPGHFADMRSRLAQHGALAESAAVIDGYLKQAQEALREVPSGPATEALAGMAGFLSHQTAALGG
jgi:octaprenyl-diphosphate synthase